MEEIITIILIMLTLLTIFCLYKILNKRGLYFALVMMDLISFVLSFKISYIFKMNINLGIIPLIASFSILYIFLTKYSAKEIKSLLLITLYANITAALLLVVMNFFIPAITETISINMQGTFEYNYKILIVYPIIVLLSQLATAKLYVLLKEIQDNNTISIALTYIITGLLYTLVMYAIAYIDIMELKFSLFLGISTYILGLVITGINILFVNLLNNKKVIK
ncbi:MAG: hypothetical protein IJE89_05215 [Bacilli bacterium]|nr:hypothetical protein [Bacilli bacterium]